MAVATTSPPAHPKPGYFVSTTRAVFYVLGITQPAPEQERAVSIAFWGATVTVALLCLLGLAAIIGSVSMLK